MSGRNDSRNVRRDRPNDHVADHASIGRSPTYYSPTNAGHSRHRDATSNDALPRYVQAGEILNRRHRDGSPQDEGPTSDRHDRHDRSRDDTGRERAIDPQLEDTDSDSESRRHYQVENRPQAVHRTSRPVPEQRLREPTAAPRERITGGNPSERPGFKSRLSQLAGVFVSIEVDDYATCRDFITQRPDILDENENDFIKDAVAALASSQSERVSRPYARRCIQQSLLLRHCKRRDRKGRERFFAQLEEEEKKTAVDFLKESEATLEHCLEKAQEVLEAASKRQPAAPAPVDGAQGTDSDSRHGPPVDDLSREVSTLNLDSSGRQRHGPTGRNARPNPRPSNTFETQQERHRRPSTATAGSNPNSVVTINQSGLLRPKQGTIINGTNGQQEELDASYFKREHAAKFFVRGRVFALLWHETAGESNNDRFSEDLTRPGRFDEPIISHIRRMVVIREGHGKCWAIPINTYRGYGIAKRGFNQYDVDGHAVIHASNTEPYTDSREPAMSKRPLMVNMAQGETLHRMSRVNFTTVHTVQHNVKVKNIGMVHQESKSVLAEYWSAQVAA